MVNPVCRANTSPTAERGLDNKGVYMKTGFFGKFAGIAALMLVGSREALALPLTPFAQIPGALRDGFQSGLGVMFLAGFVWGVVKVWTGADKMSKGDADGKMGIIAGIVIAGAAAIMGALFTIFGLNGGVLVPTF
jgi:hypothetical protein